MSGGEENRDVQSFRIDWQGIALSVEFEEHWLGIRREGPFAIAHFQVRVLAPSDARIPITETGYRSHFVPRELVAEYGGPMAFVLAWLDEAAETTAWKESVEQVRQLRLL